jgi:uncharacterized protein (TIGR03083 family)
MEIDQHLTELREHGEAMAAAAERAGPDAPVPTCPGWQVRDLVAHLGQVHRWAASYVGTGRTKPPDDESKLAVAPGDDELVPWFRDGHAALVSTLADASPDVQCWSFLPAPSPLAFWARRQAHETAIHRVDAETAAGGTVTFSEALAVDGIDELLLGFFARSGGRLVSDPPVSLALQPSDRAGTGWTVTIGPDSRDTVRGVTDATCVVAGSASDLYQLLWNRRAAGDLSVTGDRAVLELWESKAMVKWR